MIPYNKKLVQNARVLRKNMTPEEKHLWYDFLKKLPFNVRRQHNIENYIVDFYIAEKKIVIEIDGIQHSIPENEKNDKKRERILSNWNITVLRYTNESIKNCFDDVCQNIMENIGLKFSDLKSV